jgi:hypothetical protein
VPAIPLARQQPRERAQRPGDAGADDRRLRPHREHVAGDRGQRGDLTQPARDPEQPCRDQHAAHDEGDVLSRDGQKVVEAGGPEPLAQILVEPCVVAEDDAH